MEARQSPYKYTYSADDVRDLFGKIIESLSLSKPADDVISQILMDVCRHFKFTCGFVYEADYAGTFTLRERFAACAELVALPKSFRRKKHTSVEEIGKMIRSPAFLNTFGKPPEFSTVMLTPIRDDDGGLVGLVGIMDRRRDILADRRSKRALKMVLSLLGNGVRTRMVRRDLEQARRSMISILDSTGVDIYVNDFLTHEILYVNKSMAAPYGGLENMLGRKCWQALYADKSGECGFCPQKKIIDENGDPTRVFSWDYRRPFDGAWFRVLSAAFRWTDGRLAHIVSSVDITEKKKYEAEITRMANHDALTGLPNRNKLRLDYEEAARARGGGTFHLLFFDLNKFKALNDSMGHEAGDELLAKIGSVLMEHPLTANHAYRHGGDEFVLLYHDVGSEHMRRVVDFLLDRFGQPWPLKSASPVCPASIGVAVSPPGAGTLDGLLRDADSMMYKAKQTGGGVACFADGEICHGRRKPAADVSEKRAAGRFSLE